MSKGEKIFSLPPQTPPTLPTKSSGVQRAQLAARLTASHAQLAAHKFFMLTYFFSPAGRKKFTE